MKNIIFKGYHSPIALKAFKESMEKGDLFIFVPPLMSDYSFVENLPSGETIKLGEMWKTSDVLPTARGGENHRSFCAGVFSSGTTKNSKLILYSPDNIRSSVVSIYGLFDSNAFDQIYCYPQPFHTFGLTLGYGAHYFLKKEVIFSNGQYSRQCHQDWAKSGSRKITLGTPTHFYDLIQWVKENQNESSESYGSIIGGAKVKKDLWITSREFLKIKSPSIGYGASEASPGISHLPPGHEPLFDGEIGWPLPHVQYKFQKDGLNFFGPNLCAGIMEDGETDYPEALTLPDLITINPEDGRWIYQTRLNWFLNRGGEKFSLEKIELKISEEFKIRVLACKIPDRRLGEELGILVEAKESKPRIDRIYQFLEKEFGRKFHPHFAMVDQLPLNSNLKLDRIKATNIIQDQVYNSDFANL